MTLPAHDAPPDFGVALGGGQSAPCDCRLEVRDDGVGRFWYCAVHAAAPDLLVAAEAMIAADEAEELGEYLPARERLRAAVARAWRRES